MFIEQPPEFFRKLYPGAVWRMDPNEKAVYLTFDDGPIPEVTPWVLEILEKHHIKATFFILFINHFFYFTHNICYILTSNTYSIDICCEQKIRCECMTESTTLSFKLWLNAQIFVPLLFIFFPLH